MLKGTISSVLAENEMRATIVRSLLQTDHRMENWFFEVFDELCCQGFREAEWFEELELREHFLHDAFVLFAQEAI